MMEQSVESFRCEQYVSSSVSEIPFAEWIKQFDGDVGVVVTQGFEERSVGFIEGLSDHRLIANEVVIGRHPFLSLIHI